MSAVVLLIHVQSQWLEEERRAPVSVRQAGRYFPKTRRLEERDPATAVQIAVDHRGETQGALLTTAPQTDNIIGYSGPNNLLLALDPRGAIVGVELLDSGDTPEHVAKVRAATNFLQGFRGWRPSEEPVPEVAAVSGATLTSLAMTEAVRQRVGGGGLSLRFPEPVLLEELGSVLSGASALRAEGGQWQALDSSNQIIATVVRTSPQADNVSGYRGPSEALLVFGGDGARVTEMRIRRSYDTESYVEQVRRSEEFRRLIVGRTREELAELDYPRRSPEGISGATLTARAVVEGTRRRFQTGPAPQKARWTMRSRDWGLAAVIGVAVALSFSSWRRRPWVRMGWQLILVGYVGWVNRDFLSLALFGGWAAHGLADVPGLALLALAALLVPMTTRHQVYCHQICPHGAAQQLLGRLPVRRWQLPPKLGRLLERLPALLLAAGFLILLLGLPVSLINLEPFDAWTWTGLGTATVLIAVVGLVASLFVPQAYCRFGCPTGALLSFIRSAGANNRWGSRDAWALALRGAGVAAVFFARAQSAQPQQREPEVLRGEAMGTTWSVKLRDEIAVPEVLQAAIAKEFEWAESLTSNWRSNTTLSEFNRAMSTNAMAVPWAVLTLARWSREISEQTQGAFDITVGPLVRLWGFGPGARPDPPPTEAEIDAVRPVVGWQKLQLLDGMLAKDHPALEVDLSGIAKGWAIDKIVDLLVFRGYTNFLVEAGGELRASDQWQVAIEHPARPCQLTDEALASSGTYRQQHRVSGRRYSHLIDPRTGRPIAHATVSVSVRAADCARADAWATALNVLGKEAGLPLAERLGLAAQFVVEDPDGRLKVAESSAWTARERAAARKPPP